MLMNKVLKQTILASVLLAATVMAQTPYDEGQKALREQSWTIAAKQFKKAIKSTAKLSAAVALNRFFWAFVLVQMKTIDSNFFRNDVPLGERSFSPSGQPILFCPQVPRPLPFRR